MAGGTSFYFAYALSHLPKRVSFKLITKAGEDAGPEIDRMKAAGIDVICHKSRRTVCFENKYGGDSNRRTQRVRDKADAFTVEELRDVQAEVYHLGSLLADDFPPELVSHLATKGRVSIDVQGYLREVSGQEVRAIDWHGKREILQLTDILKLNEHEMEVITGLKEPRAVAKKLAGYGVREVVITLGSYGSMIYADGEFHDIPAYPPTDVVDATGCGDTYSAGYLYCRAQGMSCLEAGKYAAAMCTLKLEHSGPFDRSAEEVAQVIGR